MALTKNQKLNEALKSAIEAYQAGRTDDAIHHLVARSRHFPESAKLWGYLGFLYGEDGLHSKAILAFRKATSLSPHSEQASLGLFHSLWRVGKADTAFNEMRRFLKEYDSPRYRELLRDMLAEAPFERAASDDTLVVA